MRQVKVRVRLPLSNGSNSRKSSSSLGEHPSTIPFVKDLQPHLSLFLAAQVELVPPNPLHEYHIYMSVKPVCMHQLVVIQQTQTNTNE